MTRPRELYTKIKTIKDLKRFIDRLVKLGKGETTLWFDTDARTFEYHLAKLGAISWQSKEIDPCTPPQERIVFYEERGDANVCTVPQEISTRD